MPMPFQEQFDLFLAHHQSETVQIEMYNHYGQLVYGHAHQIHAQLNTLQITVPGLPGGFYLLSVQTADKVVSQKLLKY